MEELFIYFHVFNSIYPKYAQQMILLHWGRPFSFSLLPRKSTSKIVLEGTSPVSTWEKTTIWTEQTWPSQFVWTTLNLYEGYRGVEQLLKIIRKKNHI